MIVVVLFLATTLNLPPLLPSLFPTATPTPLSISGRNIQQMTLLQRLTGLENIGWLGEGEFSPQGDLYAAVGYDGIHLWKAPEFVHMDILGGTRYLSLAFSPNGNILAVGDYDGQIHVLNVKKRSLLYAPLTGHTHWIWDLAFSPDGNILASLSHDGVRFWDVASGNLLGGPLQDDWQMTKLLFTSDGTTLITASNGITFWDVASQSRRSVLRVPETINGVASMTLSNDGNTLVVGTINALLFWNLADLSVYQAYPMNYNPPSALAFTADDSFLVVGSYACVIRLWDVKAKKFVMDFSSGVRFNGMSRTATLSFASNGWWLANVGCEEISLWGLPGWNFTSTPTPFSTRTPSVSQTPTVLQP